MNARGSMNGGLLNVRQLGFLPQTVIDVGAALGTFDLYEVFPEARHILIEPIAENEPYLAKICRALPQAEYLIAAATRASGTATLKVAPGLVHSSASLSAQSATGEDYNLREVPAISLDDLCRDKQLPAPYLLKIDVDGNEVDVLAGATATLKQTEYVIIEVSLFNQIHSVIDVMRSQGFVIYDILDLAYRPADRALWQADMAFVREDGPLRQDKAYIPPEQEPWLLDHLQSYRDACIARIEQYYTPETPPLVQELGLRAINLVAFPDWSQPQDTVLHDLTELLGPVMTAANGDRLKLLIDSTGVLGDTANLLVSSAVMHLLTEEGLEVADPEPEITLLNPLSTEQWQTLLPHLTARVALTHEQQAAIERAGVHHLPVYASDELAAAVIF